MAFVLHFDSVSAQNGYKQLTSKIDSLMQLKLPQSALVAVDELDSKAIKDGNVPMQVKAAASRVSLQSDLSDDAQWSSIKTLKSRIERSPYPIKPVLQSLLAELYWKYYQANRYRLSKRSKLQSPGADFTYWDTQTLVNETIHLYELSLHDSDQEQHTAVGILAGDLDGDSSTRYLRPTLYDLLVHRALDFFLWDEGEIVKPRFAFKLNDPSMFGDSKSFAFLPIKDIDSASLICSGMRYLQQATLFHLRTQNKDALADLDLKRLQFAFLKTRLPLRDSLYLGGLKRITHSDYSGPITADALVLLGNYYLYLHNLPAAFSFFKKAMSEYPKSMGGKNAANQIKKMLQSKISADIEEVESPGRPLLARLNYRNVNTARVTIYKITQSKHAELYAAHDDRVSKEPYGSLSPIQKVIQYLQTLEPLQIQLLKLPQTADYAEHTVEFKIDPLENGIYILVTNDVIDAVTDHYQVCSFQVSNLSVVTRPTLDNEIQVKVMDRETGAPLEGVQVVADGTERQITDESGGSVFHLKQKTFALRLTTATDTLNFPGRYGMNHFSTDRPKSVQHTILFTDRDIYRPGQTVHLKGICVDDQPGKSSLLTYANQRVDITDQRGNPVTSLFATTNEFGSFTAIFTIPETVINGFIYLHAFNGDKSIRVEEYKRPGFLVKLSKDKDGYKPGDSVTVIGTVKAYSGFGFSHARVAYRITREVVTSAFDRIRSAFSDPYIAEIAADTMSANELGIFKIGFKASVDATLTKDAGYKFVVSADITTASGETRSASLSVPVPVKRLMIDANVPAQVSVDSVLKVSVSIKSLYKIAQRGEIKLRMYALKQPGHSYKERLWTGPDQHLLNKHDFDSAFPEISYGGEDKKEAWPVLQTVAEQSATCDGKRPVVFNLNKLEKQTSGTYKLEISAKSPAGDTVSKIYYVELLNKPEVPHSLTGWITAFHPAHGSKDIARFWVGTGKPVHVLMEKFSGERLLHSQWLDVSGGKQQEIKVPLNPNENISEIQFLTSYHNRQYHYNYVVSKPDTNVLKVKFFTFRNKLKPGRSEQWKLQILGRNGHKHVAEMVASLYDASLDAFLKASSWDFTLNTKMNNGGAHRWSEEFVYPSHTSSEKQSINYYFPIRRLYEHLSIPRYQGGLERVEYLSSGRSILEGRGDQFIMVRGSTTQQGSFVVETPQVEENTSAVRRNFAETAFFYPQLHTDKRGMITLDFTLPEELTTWRFRGFAHTKDLKAGYLEREVITQKELSISATTPRFLRAGDTVVFSATLANLSASAVKARVELHLSDGLNGRPLQLLISPADGQQTVALGALASSAVRFKMVIPSGLDALSYRLTAASDRHSDGEESTLPVLPSKVLVTESLPLTVRGGQRSAVKFDKLVRGASLTRISKTLTLEYTGKPAWYAVQALPSLVEHSNENTEELFNRYYAGCLAADLLVVSPTARRLFEGWHSGGSDALQSPLEKNPQLKATVLNETPWLKDAQSESQLRRQLALFFDPNKLSGTLRASLDQLKEKQLPGGGFSWVGGDRADRYITQYILAGIGQLHGLHHALDSTTNGLSATAGKAIAYLEGELALEAAERTKRKGSAIRTLSATEIHAYFALSYFGEGATASRRDLITNYLTLAEAQWTQRSVYERCMIALTMLRNQQGQAAMQIMKSLLETAQRNKELGMYWQDNSSGYRWYERPIETQSLLIELFKEVGGRRDDVQEMKVWLLRNKQTGTWQTTKATAAACYALLLKDKDLLPAGSGTQVKIGGKELALLKPDAKASGSSEYQRATWTNEQIQPNLGEIELVNNSTTISWGALHWQYLENLDKITSAETGLRLKRNYYIETHAKSKTFLTAVEGDHPPKVGDLIKVVIYLTADRDFEYVELKDMRPSGVEPVDVTSDNKYQDGLYYYQVTKDAATYFFAGSLKKGTYVFEYALRAAQPGRFSTGLCTVQCLYAPEFCAHTEGNRMEIRNL